MDDLLPAFIFFYGIAWAAAMSSVVRFKSFNTLWWRSGGQRAIGRYAVSFLICNVIPFAVLYLFVVWESTLNRSPGILQAHELVAAALASLSAFSLSRLLHGALLGLKSRLYTQEEFDLQSSEWIRLEPGTGEPPMDWWEHFLPGVVMFFGPLLFAVLILLAWPSGSAPNKGDNSAPTAAASTAPIATPSPAPSPSEAGSPIDWVNLLALTVGVVAVWYTIQESRRNNSVILRAKECAFTSTYNEQDERQSFHRLRIVFQNRGIALHDVKVRLVFRVPDRNEIHHIELGRSENQRDHDEFAKGMIAEFDLKSYRHRREDGRDRLALLKDPIKQRAEIQVLSQDYLAYTFRSWSLWERMKRQIYLLVVWINWAQTREVRRNEQGIPIAGPYFEIPLPVGLLWPMECLGREMARPAQAPGTGNGAREGEAG